MWKHCWQTSNFQACYNDKVIVRFIIVGRKMCLRRMSHRKCYKWMEISGLRGYAKSKSTLGADIRYKSMSSFLCIAFCHRDLTCLFEGGKVHVEYIWVSFCRTGKISVLCLFLSDPGIPGVRSMGPSRAA